MNAAIEHVKKWVETVVVGLNFCPFAAKEVARQSIRYVVHQDATLESTLKCLQAECEHLDQQTADQGGAETTLIIFPDAMRSFDTFTDYLNEADYWLQTAGYEGTYQLASFHPEYTFTDTTFDDPSNYTNRSPYPIFHILRESSLSHVLDRVADPDAIPAANIAKAETLGIEALQQLLRSCVG